MNGCPMKCGPASVCAQLAKCRIVKMEKPARSERIAKVARVPLEHHEQRALFSWARVTKKALPELGEMFAVPNGARTAMSVAKRLKAEGLKKGVEDVMLLVARGGYHGLLIEMKRVNGVDSDVSDEQREWHDIHRARGFLVVVCNGAEEAKAVLLSYLSQEPTRVVRR